MNTNETVLFFILCYLADNQATGRAGGALFPSVFNLASGAEVTANATCGQAEPEIYCKLVEHVYVREPQCGVSYAFVMTLCEFIAAARFVCVCALSARKVFQRHIRPSGCGDSPAAASLLYPADGYPRLFLTARFGVLLAVKAPVL